MSGAKNDTFVNGFDGRAKFYIDGKGVYARLLIKIRLYTPTPFIVGAS